MFLRFVPAALPVMFGVAAAVAATPRADRFGQPVDEEFPGKIHDEGELRADATAEFRSLPEVSPNPKLDAHGGILAPQLGLKATGFFRVEKIRGRWWFVTPEGNPFFLVGCDGIKFDEGGYTTPIADKDGKARPELTDLPDKGEFPEAYPFDNRVSFLVANLKRKYGPDFARTYPEIIRRRYADWGFNSTAKWGWGRKLPGVPYFEDIYLTFCKFGGNFVDMYHPDFERRIDEVAKTRTERLRDDPDLIAWAVDNENGWWCEASGSWSNKVFDAICGAADGKPGSFAKKAFLDSVAASRGIASESLAGLATGDFTLDEKRKFIVASSVRYHRIVATAFRKCDPNHMFMGASICQSGQQEWIEAALPYLDFVGAHRYSLTPLGDYHRERLLPALARAEKPFAMLEFGFVCEGAGFKRFFARDAICRDHRARGQAYRHYVERLSAEPLCLGYGYFLYHDQAINGRGSDGEAYNLGLVSQQDRPYEEMIREVRKSNLRAPAIHAGKITQLFDVGDQSRVTENLKERKRARPDARRTTALGKIRLSGYGAEKMNAFFRNRIFSEAAAKEVFGEARAALLDRSDDEWMAEGRRIGGWWRGEFWGKLMIGASRVAEYSGDPALRRFLVEECRRVMASQDADGYLGSYADKTNVAIVQGDRAAVTKHYGWNSSWNIWCRKYVLWGMLAAYRATRERDILESCKRQADQLIDMMHGLKLRLAECGQPEKVGLPPMSILKPLVLLYRETGARRYLDYAEEMLPDWNRADGACPNLLRNAGRPEALWTWYPNPHLWGKSYEMMSCLDGLLEHARATGSVRGLQAVASLRENLLRTEANALGDVGHWDQFYGAADQPNASTELCDTVHWIRLNLDLYLMTGETRYCDAMELAYYNAFLAGVCRDGTWGAFAVRSAGHHRYDLQCGYRHNHCCVNNLPRTFMDMAEGAVTADREGAYHVSFYQDAQVEIDGVRFAISGGYPVSNRVHVTTSRPVNVKFRTPAWCPALRIVREGACEYGLTFDMNPRLCERSVAPAEGQRAAWFERSFTFGESAETALHKGLYRTTAAATLMYGPLLLAKGREAGSDEGEFASSATVAGEGYSVRLERTSGANAWAVWNVELTKPGAPTVRAKACDYQSAGDRRESVGKACYSIWF